MPIPPPRDPAEAFQTLIRCLSEAVVTQGLLGRVANVLVAAIIDRLRGISQRVVGIAARVRANRYRWRRYTNPRRPPVLLRPRRADPLPRTFGWLLKLVPEAVQHRGQLEFLFNDAGMAALLQAAPASLRRPLRSLCHMLRLQPPPVLAPTQRPAKPPPPPGPPPLAPPAPALRPPAPRACGPPLPA